MVYDCVYYIYIFIYILAILHVLFSGKHLKENTCQKQQTPWAEFTRNLKQLSGGIFRRQLFMRKTMGFFRTDGTWDMEELLQPTWGGAVPVI